MVMRAETDSTLEGSRRGSDAILSTSGTSRRCGSEVQSKDSLRFRLRKEVY